MRPPRGAVVVSVVLVLSGCLGFGGPPPSDPGAEAVVEDAVAFGSDVETYRFESDLRVVASSDGESRRVTAAVSGAVNRARKRSHATSRVGDRTRETYVVGDTVYTECRAPWGWGVENESRDGSWRSSDALGRQLDLLASSPVYWAGNETRDGTTVRVVEARPSGDALSKYAERRATEGVFGPNVEDATLTAWVVADSGRLLKTELSFAVSDGGATADAHMTTRFTDYGANVAVTVPDEVTDDPHKLGCPGG